jgi:hypothetical protein
MFGWRLLHVLRGGDPDPPIPPIPPTPQ